VYLWLERFIIPIGVAIVVSAVIVNPLKFDWQQRISLLVAIFALTYFVSHTVYKPKASATADSDQRIRFLERQVEDTQAQLKQLAGQQADDATNKQTRK
jgi:ABC-type transport system involved in cytochrome bd biosynthesis fused ATPase/permease subunit